MANTPFTPDELLQLRALAAQWGKIVSRRAFGDGGPGLDVDFRTFEQTVPGPRGAAPGSSSSKGVQMPTPSRGSCDRRSSRG